MQKPVGDEVITEESSGDPEYQNTDVSAHHEVTKYQDAEASSHTEVHIYKDASSSAHDEVPEDPDEK